MEFGATFSDHHLRWLGLNPIRALMEYKSIGFTWIRLGCYWNEIEKNPGKFSFTELDVLVKVCEREKLKIVMSVGMKAPRWPEYYLPDWVSAKFHPPKLTGIEPHHKYIFDKTMRFVDRCIRHYKSTQAIRVWQVENEPLDLSGENQWRISPNFLRDEVTLVRKIDPKRKIMINLWGNELSKRKSYKEAIQLADIVGLDIYLHRPVSFFFHRFTLNIGPLDSKKTLHEIIDEITIKGKEFWLAELQAEPWETDRMKSITINPFSFRSENLRKNMEYGELLDPSVILFWGFEHWYYKRIKGDASFWDMVVDLI